MREEGYIIQKYKSTVYGIAITRTKNIHDADDIFQEVFLAYYKKERTFSSDELEKAWFIKTTIYCTFNLFRKFKQFYLPLDENLLTGFEFEPSQDKHIYETLLQLSEKYRTTLYLHYIEGYKTGEIASLLDTKDSTIRMRLKRGREQMKELWIGDQDEDK